MMQPLLTILMPVYNAELYLTDAINSILSQTYKDFVFLIINDGSTDNSEKIITSYADSRIHYVRNEKNVGLVATLNKGLTLVRTKYIARMDADDVCLSQRFEKQIAFLNSHPEVGVLGSWCKVFGDSQGEIKYAVQHNEIMFKHLYKMELIHPTCVLRTDIIKKFNFAYDEQYEYAEDYELFTRMSHRTQIYNLPEILYLYRNHNTQVSKIHSNRQNINSIKIRKREFSLLGLVDISTRILEDFSKLNYQDYDTVQSSSFEIQQLLESMICGNRSSHLFDDNFLYEKLSNLWFSYCYETKKTKSLYMSSLLARKVSFIKAFKWFFKIYIK